jgi:hypothetical protein
MNEETAKRVIKINDDLEKTNIAISWANNKGSFAYAPNFPNHIIRVPEKLNEKITDILIQYREELEKELKSL